MKIIIPMAGLSKRFKDKGYFDPKQFIMIDGKPMIYWVCQMFSSKDEYIFVANKNQLAKLEYLVMLQSVRKNYQIVLIDDHGLGPVYSVLQAKDQIADKSEPIIISYCDFTMKWDYRQFLMKATMYDGAIPVFRGFHPASYGDTYYAYLRANEAMEMLELREKCPFTDDRASEYASTGVYYLDSWHTFEKYARRLLDSPAKDLPEYYCSLLYNPMVQDGKKVTLFEVEKFICWGTPADLEEYNFWSNYFKTGAVFR